MSAPRVTLFLTLLLLLSAPCSRVHGQDDSSADDEAILKGAGVPTDGPALVAFFQQRTPSEEKRQKLAKTIRRLGDNTFSVREQASAALVASGSLAEPLLKAALADADLEVARRAGQCLELIQSRSDQDLARAAARLLAVRQPEGVTEVLLDYLPFANDELLEEDLLRALGSVGWQGGRPRLVLVKALKDAVPARRAAAALVLGRRGDAALRAEVVSLLADADPRVRLRAAQGLVAGKEKRAVPTLVALLTEAPPALASQAEETLYHIAGEEPPQASGSAAQCRDSWASWWRDHEATIDLARLGQPPHALGLTLIVVYDGYGGHGRVWEMQKDGKPRWTLNDVRGCLDGQMIAANRVLLAEYDGLRVTERTVDGKMLWKFDLSERPVSCQRLPNSNTLIATNHQILEVTREGKIAATRPSHHGLIFTAQKLRNGNVVYATHDGMLVELSSTGEEVATFNFPRPTQGLVSVEVLPGGRYLIPITASNKIVEFNRGGKSVWECPVANPTAATRLANGNTLICSNHDKRVVEVDRSGKVVWEQLLEGRPFRVHRR